MTHTARETPSSEDLSSSPHVLSFSPLLFSLCLLKTTGNLRQKLGGKIGQLEAVKRNLEDQMVCVEDPRKIVEKQLSDLEE